MGPNFGQQEAVPDISRVLASTKHMYVCDCDTAGDVRRKQRDNERRKTRHKQTIKTIALEREKDSHQQYAFCSVEKTTCTGPRNHIFNASTEKVNPTKSQTNSLHASRKSEKFIIHKTHCNRQNLFHRLINFSSVSHCNFLPLSPIKSSNWSAVCVHVYGPGVLQDPYRTVISWEVVFWSN